MKDDDAERFFNKIEKIDERLSNIDVSLVRQTVSLEEHVRRTNLLENEIRPIKRHVLMVEASLKVVGLLSIILGIAAALRELFY